MAAVSRTAQARTILLGVIAVVVAFAALRAMWAVSMPVAFAMLLAAMLWPLQRWLQRRLPRWLAVMLAVLVLAAALAALAAIIWLAARQVMQLGPQFTEQLEQFADRAATWLHRRGVMIQRDQLLGRRAAERAVQWATGWIQSIWFGLGLISFILFLLILMLLEVNEWQTKAREAFHRQTSRDMLHTCRIISEKIERFLLLQTVISAISGVLTAAWCFALGVEFALLWGLLAFVLNYLPNIGSFIAFIPPVLLAMLQYDWWWALVVLAALGGTDTILGNVVHPKLLGRSLKLSPLVVLVAVVFWSWVWGIAGAFLAVPITASIAIACLHVDGLRPIGILLSRPDRDEEGEGEEVKR